MITAAVRQRIINSPVLAPVLTYWERWNGGLLFKMKPELTDLYFLRDQMQKMIDEYEAKYPDFTIERIEVIKKAAQTNCGTMRSTHIELDARIKVQP